MYINSFQLKAIKYGDHIRQRECISNLCPQSAFVLWTLILELHTAVRFLPHIFHAVGNFTEYSLLCALWNCSSSAVSVSQLLPLCAMVVSS